MSDSIITSCEKKMTIPQFSGTCWFNALLMALFFSDGLSGQKKTAISALESKKISKSKMELLKILKQILNVSQNNSAKTIEAFYETMRPEKILETMHLHNKKLFYFDPNKSSGFKGESYISQFITLLNMQKKVLFLTEYKNEYYYSYMNTFDYRGILVKSKGKKTYEIDIKTSMTKMRQHHKDNFNIKNIEIVIISNYETINEENKGKFVKISLNTINDKISIADKHFKHDALLLGNHNSNSCQRSHQIAGVTCQGKRFLYNGWLVPDSYIGWVVNKFTGSYLKKPYPCNLVPFDWNKETKNFCIDSKNCKFTKDLKVDSMCYNIVSKMATKIYTLEAGQPTIVQDNTSNDCPKTKILNPKTNRCVSKTGAIGKSLLSSGTDIKKTDAKQLAVKCPVDKILNPKTNRCVSKTGAIGKKIMLK